MTDNQLKPTQAELPSCPFCGGAAEWRDDPGVCGEPFGLVVDHQPSCFFGLPVDENALITAWSTRLSQSGNAERESEAVLTDDVLDSPVELCVVRWEGRLHCAYLNDFRLAGGKPWGGGSTEKSWNTTLREVIRAFTPLQKALGFSYLGQPLPPASGARIEQETPSRERSRDVGRQRLLGLEWTEDGYSLRTPYDGDADSDGRAIIVGGDIVVTFADSAEGEEAREAFIVALAPASPEQPNPSPVTGEAAQKIVAHLRSRAEGFHAAAKAQGKRVGPLARGFENAAREIEQAFPALTTDQSQTDRLRELSKRAADAPWVVYSEPEVGLFASVFSGTVGQTGFAPVNLDDPANVEFIVEAVNFTRAALSETRP